MDSKVISLFAAKKVEALKPRWTAYYNEMHRVDLLSEFCTLQDAIKKEGFSDELLIRGLVLCGIMLKSLTTVEMRTLVHAHGRMFLLEAQARGIPWNDPILNLP